ncbi:MAG: PEGA domain-containing protein [Polyangiaceae bacterium]|nr:PEGA domain-containing protein [Polyangiaceae bacterium]
MPSGLPPLTPPPSKPSTLPIPSRPPTLNPSAGPPSLSRGLPPVTPPPSRPPSLPLPAVSGASAPLPPPTAPAAKANSVVDMDWDDEDEKTSIYDKEETQKDLERVSGKPLPAAGMPAPKPNLGTAAALAAGSGGAASNPLPAPMPLPPPGPLPPSTTRAPTPPPGTLPTAQAQPARFDNTQVVSKQGGGKNGMVLGVVGLALVAAGAFFVLQPKNGNLVVSVKGKTDGRTIEAAKVELNGKVVCEKTPCRVSEIPKGAHMIKAAATGFDPNDLPVTIRAGEDSTVVLELMPSREAVTSAVVEAPKASGTGFKAAGPAHIKVALDGKDLGPLPQEVKDSTPGAHKIKFYSSDRYQADERSVTFTENKIEDLGSIKLKVLKGKATINLETAGSAVTLVSGTERRAIPQFPISIDIDTSKTWTIEAKKIGHEDFKMPIAFDDGEAEKTFAVVLYKKGEKKPEPKPLDKPTDKPTDKPADKPADKPEPPKTADTGMATLNINSIPPSNAILDGRPLGQTPRPGVSVPAGTHTVVFVHPEKGRKTQTVTVKGGDTKPVIVKF